MNLWTAKDAAAATGGQTSVDWVATGVSIDTRTLQPGDLFVALKDVRDGHEFVAQALANGAGAALVSHVPDDVAPDAPLLLVDDVLGALEDLGRAARARTEARVLAVTGSVGKTSTKEMLISMLEGQGRTHASVASYNNHWGVPLTLARMPQNTDFAIIEIGMNHPGEIAPLARLARPHVVMVTTVAPAHLEAFEDVAEIAREKSSITDGLEPGGVAVLNGDLETTDILIRAAQAANARIVTFGENTGCDHQITRIRVTQTASVVEAQAGSEPLLYKIGAPGRHFALNALGALAAVDALGADQGLACVALGQWSAVAGRGARETIQLDAVEQDLSLDLIDDAYNANPASMAAALAVLAESEVHDDVGRVAKGRRIAFVGDMKELGQTEATLHADLADLPAMQRIDRVHCVGPLMRHLHEALPEFRRGSWTETSAEMVTRLRRHLDSGDVVLVKGSLSMKMALIVDAIRKMGHPAPQDDE